MIDCHLHLQDPRLPREVSRTIATIREAGISRLVVNGTHPGDWNRVAELASAYPEIITPSFGLHPWKVNTASERWIERLEELLEQYPDAAVGEIGLDKWVKGHDIVKQKNAFTIQLQIARRFNRPVSVHCLQAWRSLQECLDHSNPGTGILLHSFGGPREMVNDLVISGAYFSLSGYFFRPGKEEKLRRFESIPADRILLETDAPDMMPPLEMVKVPLSPDKTGNPVNHPANLVSIYEAYADWRGISTEQVIGQIRQTFDAWFSKRDLIN